MGESCFTKAIGGMGFRQLVHFNQALLAKQIWRLVRHPSSLLARVLKAKYFKHMDIMHGPIGNNPSYIWRSLMWGRELLHKGLFWRNGDGNSIRILFGQMDSGTQ